MRRMLLSAAAALLLTGATPALADDFYFYSSDGPMEVHVGPSGGIFGQYQQDSGARRAGRLVGRAHSDGRLDGLWLQADSDHPCNYPREGTIAWGRFTINGAWSGQPYGVWGYCDEFPSHSWNLQRR